MTGSVGKSRPVCGSVQTARRVIPTLGSMRQPSTQRGTGASRLRSGASARSPWRVRCAASCRRLRWGATSCGCAGSSPAADAPQPAWRRRPTSHEPSRAREQVMINPVAQLESTARGLPVEAPARRTFDASRSVSWRDLDATLSSVIGARGVAAVYARSLDLERGCASVAGRAAAGGSPFASSRSRMAGADPRRSRSRESGRCGWNSASCSVT